jgi:hypothetical protein
LTSQLFMTFLLRRLCVSAETFGNWDLKVFDRLSWSGCHRGGPSRRARRNQNSGLAAAPLPLPIRKAPDGDMGAENSRAAGENNGILVIGEIFASSAVRLMRPELTYARSAQRQQKSARCSASAIVFGEPRAILIHQPAAGFQ